MLRPSFDCSSDAFMRIHFNVVNSVSALIDDINSLGDATRFNAIRCVSGDYINVDVVDIAIDC
jgi:hypothetical protein